MEFLFLLAVFAMIVVLIYIFTHLQSLTESEIGKLAQKRRNDRIRNYFFFDNREYNADKKFKKNMRSDGRFYKIEERLFEFPAVAAGLLKYKKHEWIIIAFEKEKRVELIWLNKGKDNKSVSWFLSASEIVETAKQHSFSSVLVFHNHPNPSPRHYSCTQPSELDIETANQQGVTLNANDINLLEFVCEKGRHYEYFRSPSAEFFPISQFIKEIRNVNGVSRLKNLSLHLENTFKR